ncbi:hypothetical protein ACFQXA_23100 [Nocardiopsis composta]
MLATLGYLALLLAVAGLVAWALLRSLRVPWRGAPLSSPSRSSSATRRCRSPPTRPA